MNPDLATYNIEAHNNEAFKITAAINPLSEQELLSFLQCGAFLRHPDGRVFLWQGPFQADYRNKSQLAQLEFFSESLKYLSSPLGFRCFSAPQVQALQNQLQSISNLPSWNFNSANFDDFANSFQRILEKINAGAIDKALPVVFSKAFSDKAPTANEKAYLMKSALQVPSALWVYGFWDDNEGIIGATPEYLFLSNQHGTQSMALAGTCPDKEMGHRPPLLQDQKELHEHQLVVQDIQSRLQRFGRVQTEPIRELALPGLKHLQTLMHLDFVPDASELVNDMHPTPALGVSPRSYGYRWMQDLPQQQERKWHGGVFLFDVGEFQVALVCIRNMMWTRLNQNTDGPKIELKIGAGCGLVQDSQLEREWGEVLLKINSVKRILGIT